MGRYVMAAPAGQNNWRFCTKCFGLFLNIGPTDGFAGVCPAGGKHEAVAGKGPNGLASWDYIVIADRTTRGKRPVIYRPGY